MNWENLAKAGYEVYWKQMRQSGLQVKVWDGLGLAERMAWIAATQEICGIHVAAALA